MYNSPWIKIDDTLINLNNVDFITTSEDNITVDFYFSNGGRSSYAVSSAVIEKLHLICNV